jgi:glutamate synthase (NADPH/NADH) small chain
MTSVPEAIEVESTYTRSQAMQEASRCLQCFDPPCTKACPAEIVIPRFIRMIRSTNIQGASEVIRSSNPMAMSCGFACPGEQLCETACIRQEIDHSVEIRRLHRFATEQEAAAETRRPAFAALKGKSVGKGQGGRVAIVGAGPAGLACAFALRRHGIPVTVFERRDRLGGVLSSTIPRYRFPDQAVKSDASWIRRGDPGIDLRLRTPVDDVEGLARTYDAVFIGTGLGSMEGSVPGTELKGVVTGEEFLSKCRRRRYRNPIGDEIVVIGGGNVAIDAALGAIRCGEVQSQKPRVQILYRRTRAEMPAWEREVSEAEKLGVIAQFLVLPVAFVGQGRRLTGIRLCRVSLGTPDASGRPSPVAIDGSDFVLPCDQAILAIGQRIDRGPLGNLPLTREGLLKISPRTQRVRDNIYAGGDASGPDQTIVAAVRDGKRAARAITAQLDVRRL